MNRSTDVWRFQPHPEVWLLVAAVAVAYWFAVTRIGPKVVAPGEPVVTRRQVRWFASGVLVMWLASDWPVHDLAEEYLYSVHMLQHMALSYFMPAMVLLGTPTWLARLLIGGGRAERAVRILAKPVVAALLFNAVVMVTHIPGVVNNSVDSALLHYGLHVLVVGTALVMWLPICGPLPELRLTSAPGQMLYLFAMSVVPTVPAGWLTFAEGVVYKAYDHGVRVWGLTVTEDQQFAGMVMKLGGSAFLWILIARTFFRWAMRDHQSLDHSYRRTPPTSTLTYDEVEKAFEQVPAPVEH